MSQRWIQLDFKRAILLPFSGKDWYLRIIVLSILSFPVTSFYCNLDINNFIFIFFILLSLLLGYFSQYAHNEFNNIYPRFQHIKPNFIKYFKQGLICSVGVFISFLRFFCFFLILFLLIKILYIYLNLPLLSLIKALSRNSFFYTVINQILRIFIFFIIFTTPCLYAYNFEFKNISNFSKLLIVTLSAKLEILICLITYIILSKIIEIAAFYMAPIYIKIVIVSIMISSIYLIVFDLFVQIFILAEHKLINKGETANE